MALPPSLKEDASQALNPDISNPKEDINLVELDKFAKAVEFIPSYRSQS